MFFCMLTFIFLIEVNPLDGYVLFGISVLFKAGLFIPIVSLILGTNNLGLPISIIKCIADICAFVVGYAVSKLLKSYNDSYEFIYWLCFWFSLFGLCLGLVLNIKLR